MFIGLKVRSTVIRLKAGFEDTKAAREYRDENREELQTKIDELRTRPTRATTSCSAWSIPARSSEKSVY